MYLDRRRQFGFLAGCYFLEGSNNVKCKHLGRFIDGCYVKNPRLRKPQTSTSKGLISNKNKQPTPTIDVRHQNIPASQYIVVADHRASEPVVQPNSDKGQIQGLAQQHCSDNAYQPNSGEAIHLMGQNNQTKHSLDIHDCENLKASDSHSKPIDESCQLPLAFNLHYTDIPKFNDAGDVDSLGVS